ncbi:hypothetical protein ACGFIJ_29920 [Microbispora bryophytorum]|uniref:hypothetical protein n=1 Tax=Microbispora bryophytorum TaxID=1460882 RepID=UPI003716D0E7
MTPDECAECAAASRRRGDLPNYDHFHKVDALPRARRADSRTTLRGYAVGMGGSLPQTWVFFEHLEPALAFGRAGRMSCHDIRSYGVYEAARETRYDRTLKRDVHTLFLAGSSLDRQDDEAQDLQRWLQGCVPGSAYFEPPKRRDRLGM